jgi:glycolate oxidase
MSVTHGTQTTAGPVPGPVAPEDTEATGRTGSNPEAMAAVTAAARTALPPDGLIDDHVRLRTYECDGLAHYKVTPALVVLPENAEQLAAVVRACAQHGVPFVARGSGTGLSGGALPRADGVLIVTARMRAIREIRRADQRAIVEPGVINLDITRAATPDGYYFAPDPSSQQICSIGGNLAENSGGAHCLKYGFTANHVLGAEFVTPQGEVVQLGGLAPDAPGYDLLGAVVGSEGTLGVATAVTVKLTRLPEDVRTLLVGFRSTDDAGAATSAIIGAGIVPAAIEMMDALSIEAAEAATHCGYPAGAGAVLVIELDGAEVEVERELAEVERLCRENGAFEERLATDPAERALIWKGRKSAFAAVGRISPDYIVQDGVIPRTALPEVLRAINELSSSSGVRVANVFHAGDGNLHPLVLFDDAIEGAGEAAEKVSGAILDLCISHGGSITGEHGVGIDKAAYMPKMFTDDDLDTMQLVRCAFDPAGVANPGKIFPTPRLCGEIPGKRQGAHPLVEAGLAEAF